eukprot:357111-Chlamydomonas_euryale.AAC.8
MRSRSCPPVRGGVAGPRPACTSPFVLLKSSRRAGGLAPFVELACKLSAQRPAFSRNALSAERLFPGRPSRGTPSLQRKSFPAVPPGAGRLSRKALPRRALKGCPGSGLSAEAFPEQTLVAERLSRSRPSQLRGSSGAGLSAERLSRSRPLPSQLRGSSGAGLSADRLAQSRPSQLKGSTGGGPLTGWRFPPPSPPPDINCTHMLMKLYSHETAQQRDRRQKC